MRCGQCGAVVDRKAPESDGWLRVNLARHHGAATVQLDERWLCSLECTIAYYRQQLLAAGEVDAELGSAQRELDGMRGLPRLWTPGG